MPQSLTMTDDNYLPALVKLGGILPAQALVDLGFNSAGDGTVRHKVTIPVPVL